MFIFKKNLDTFEIQYRLKLLYKQLNRKAAKFSSAEKKATIKSKVNK
jgi:hypothetical protein